MQQNEGGISTIELHEDLNNATFIVADVLSRVYFTDFNEDVTPIIIARNPSMLQFQSCVLQPISTVPEMTIRTDEIVNPFSGNRRNINKYTSKNLVSEKVRPRYSSPQTTGDHCSFCYTNQSQVYDHMLKLKIGSRTVIVCPVLRKYVCPKCGATGDNAHTITYCPKTIREYGYKPDSVAKLLSKTSRNACGRPRPKDKKVCNPFQMSQ